MCGSKFLEENAHSQTIFIQDKSLTLQPTVVSPLVKKYLNRIYQYIEVL